MGLCNSPDIFQEKMNELFAVLEYIWSYIDNLLVTSKELFDNHLNKLNMVLTRLGQAGLKVNTTKPFFAQEELEYLGYLITQEVILPLKNEIQAMQQITAPKTIKQLRSFIGMLNYY